MHGVSPTNGRRTLSAHPGLTSLDLHTSCDAALRAVRPVTCLRDRRKTQKTAEFNRFYGVLTAVACEATAPDTL